jgi:hypothetical protein
MWAVMGCLFPLSSVDTAVVDVFLRSHEFSVLYFVRIFFDAHIGWLLFELKPISRTTT